MDGLRGSEGVGRARRLTILVNAALVLGGVVVGLVLVESSLRLHERVAGSQERELSAVGRQAGRRDPRLGFRMPPNAPGHDAWGFRNPSVPARAAIVALGDSQTWGYNVPALQAWPRVLQELSGRAVYNMAIPGYGPVQYAALLDEALRLSPQVVAVGLYFGNDLYDAYGLAYESELYRDLRDAALGAALARDTTAPAWRASQEDFERYETRFARIRLTRWLASHVETARVLIRAGWWPDWDQDVAVRYARSYPASSTWFDGGPVRTILIPRLRLLALDQDEVRVREGLRITRGLLGEMQERAASTSTRMLVLLIPTKEAAFERVYRERAGDPGPEYGRLLAMETRARRDLIDLLQRRGIAHVDLLPVFSEALRQNRAIYLPGGDGHPTAAGHGLIARTVLGEIGRLGW